MKLSLQTKTALFVALVLGIASIISTTLFVVRQMRGIERNLVEQGEAFVYAIAQTAEAGIRSENLDLLNKAAHIIQDDNVALIQVYATTWDAIDAHPFEQLQAPPLPEAKEHFKASQAIFYKKTGEAFDFYCPVTYTVAAGNPPIPLGFTRIVLSTTRAQRSIRNTFLFGIAVSACLTALSLLLVNAGMRRLVVTPVSRLTRSMSLFQRGEIREDIPITSTDELGTLSGAFNTMKQALLQNEAALKEREQRISLILNSIAEGIYGVDLRGNCTFCNPAALRILGYERQEDLIGKHIHSLIHHTRQDGSPYPSKECRIYNSCHENQGVHVDDEVFWRADGSSFPAEYWAQPIRQDGAPAGAVTAFIDITARKAAEKALRESEEKFRTLFEESADVFYISTPAGKFLDINPAGVALFGYSSREELLAIDLGRDLYVDREERDRFVELVKRTGYTKNYEVRMRRKDGEVLSVSIMSTAVRNAAGEVIVFRGIIRDETERKQLEEQLRQSQKMESVGTLAGGVAHDFNNILAAITGYGNMALMRMRPDDPLRPNIQQILESADRAARLTQDLLLFSRKQAIVRRPLDLNASIQKLGNFLARVIGEDISFKTILSGGTISVLADQHQLDQVLMNLATNARDAMPKGGIFTVATEIAWLDEQDIRNLGHGKPGQYALISVSDNGTGMDEATKQRIFEPFFTTKEVGKGTGLGLSVVYGIVKQHDGLLNVQSEPGHGTTFRIYLPVNESTEDAVQAVPDEVPPVGGTETILLAEDDKTVREMTQMMLEDFGYTVITSVDGNEAVKVFRENRSRIRLLLFDLIMPNKTGKDAYEEIKQLEPGIKVIFQSGYDPDMVRHKALLEQNMPVVYKPVPMAELLRTIRNVLESN